MLPLAPSVAERRLVPMRTLSLIPSRRCSEPSVEKLIVLDNEEPNKAKFIVSRSIDVDTKRVQRAIPLIFMQAQQDRRAGYNVCQMKREFKEYSS